MVPLYKIIRFTLDNNNIWSFFYREILLDIFPMSGTPAAFEILSDYIRKAKTSPERMSVAINAFTVTAYPDINIAKYLLVSVNINKLFMSFADIFNYRVILYCFQVRILLF